MQETKEKIYRPTLGIALSGTGSRLIFYVGLLEVFRNHKIPIDYIAASSSGSIVAAAYACGTLEVLKAFIFNTTKESLLKLLKKAKKGLYSIEAVEKIWYEKITKGQKFEEVRPLMGFLATDIEKSEQVVISMGDIARAVRISCTLPAIIEPVKWGGKTLIDGGLLNIIPVDVVRNAGVDIVIGVNMRGTKHMFTTGQMTVKKVFNLVKKTFLIDYLEKAWGWMLSSEEKELDFETPPGLFTTLGKSMDLAIKAHKCDSGKDLECDLMITPKGLNKYKFKDYDNFNRELFEYGRKVAIEHLPAIKSLIAAKEKSFLTKV